MMTSAELQAAILAAAAVGTFTIPADFAGSLNLAKLKGIAPDRPFVLRQERGGVLASLNLSACADVVLEDVVAQLRPTPATRLAANVVRIADSERITWLGGDISSGPMPAGPGIVPFGTPTSDPAYAGLVEGLPVGRGLVLERCKDVAVRRVEIRDVHKGVCPATVDGFALVGSHIHHVRTSMVTGGKVQRAFIDWNHLHDSRPYRTGSRSDDHCDFIHLWTGTATSPGVLCQDYVITNNLLDQGEGHYLIAIQLDDNGTAVGFERVLIQGNRILTSHSMAISLENVRSARVLDNQLLQVTTPEGSSVKPMPSIRLDPNCTDAEVRGNEAGDVYKTFEAFDGNVALAAGPTPAAELDAVRLSWSGTQAQALGLAPPPPVDWQAKAEALASEVEAAEAALVACRQLGADLTERLRVEQALAASLADELAAASKERDALATELAAANAKTSTIQAIVTDLNAALLT